MSARGTSRGGLRRSSSLTTLNTLSRPSIGIGQHGAQRVSGVGCDSGSRFTMGSTLKRHASQSAIGQASSTKQRPSGGGSSCLKDTRPFSDRLYRERMVRELVQFLTAHRYPYPINLKTANGPSTADFRKIFEFLVSHIQPNFKLGPKLDESVMTALKSYCYPFTISKSHLSTIGVQHTWPPLLAALSFLRVCIESVEQVDIESLLASTDDNGEPSEEFQLYNKFVEAAYATFLSGADEEYQPLLAELEKKIESCSVQSADVEQQEIETDRNRQILAQLESQPNELVKLENENETLSLDIEKMEKYLAGMEKWKSEAEANMLVLVGELQQKVTEKDALTGELQRKRYVASNQRVSGVDAQRINSQLSELKTRVNQADKELADLDRELNAEEQLYSQEKMSLAASVAEYNRTAQMLQLIPSSAANAAGVDYEMKSDLTQAESIRFETAIMPALHMLSQNMTEKCRHREDEVAKMKEGVEQSRELIADCRDECATLTNSITAIDKKLEQTKESNAMKIQQLQCQIDEHHAVIASRNKHGALASCRQLLQSDKDRLEAERKDLQEKEDAYCHHLLKVAED